MGTRIAIFLACAAALRAAQDRAEFEVTSVKPSTSVNTGFSVNTSQTGEFTATNVTLRTLIAFAFNIRDFQISGGPKWLETERYDIIARPPHGESVSPQVTSLRVKALLADRFQLAVHTETKDLPVYALVVGKNGVHLAPADPANPRKGISHNPGVLECWGVTMKTFAEKGAGAAVGQHCPG